MVECEGIDIYLHILSIYILYIEVKGIHQWRNN